MKKLLIRSLKMIIILLSFTVFLIGCKKKAEGALEPLDKDTSYAFGMYMGNQMTATMGPDLPLDYDSFMEGFKAYYNASETRLTPDEAIEKINAVFMQIQAQTDERILAEGETNRIAGEEYLADNGRRSEVKTTSSGLQYEVITEGSGRKPSASDTVQVNYEGSLIDGTVFDSSYSRGVPFETRLDMVIPGWTEGVQLMSEGSTYRFVIPSDLAYGPSGSGPIPPSSTLVFKVELISILNYGN